MYLKGSKWSYTHRRRRSSPFRLIFLGLLVAGMLYINQVVVPATPPLFVPTPTPTRAPESFVTEAEKYLADGKINPAVQSYRDAILADPRNPSNFISLARLLIYSGEYEEAITNAENALVLSPNNSMAHAIRGWGFLFNGEYLEAETALNQAIRLDPNNAVAYAFLAEVLATQYSTGAGELGTLDKAIDTSKTAQSLGPNLMETHRARGLVLEITGNTEEAVAEFEAAVAINPNISDLHLALGRNYRALGINDKAVEEFQRANSLNPTDPMPLIYISRTYAMVGEYAKAIQYAEQAIQITPDDPFLYGNLGTMLYRNYKYPDAIEALRMAIRGGSTKDGVQVEGIPIDGTLRVTEYYYIYGLALARQGECNEAVQISDTLIRTVPDDETAVYNAEEMVNICKDLADNPPGTATPDAGEETGEEGSEAVEDGTTGEDSMEEPAATPQQ